MTGDLSIDGLCAVLDAEATTDGTPADSPLPGLDLGGEASSAPHVRGAREPECRSTRAAMHDYLTRRLPDRHARRLEAHMDGCARCIRAFIDIREASWARRTPADAPALTVTRTRSTGRAPGSSRRGRAS